MGKLLVRERVSPCGNSGLVSIFVATFLSACSTGSDGPVVNAAIGSGSEQITRAEASSSVAVAGSQAGDLLVVDVLPPPLDGGASAQARIAENDLLEIDVFQVDELDRTVRVEGNGSISMPLIGQLGAAGRTVTELEGDLERAYGRNYLQSPEITVFVKESFAQRVTLDGEFQRTGVQPVTSQTTLLQVLAQAGGLTKIADEKKLFVYRDFGGQKRVANYSVKDIREGKKADPRLYAGDVIVAFPSNAKVAAQNLREALGLVTSIGRVAAPL